ncbi:lymphocyte antigen 6B-like [Sinocyclocheilus grahami]|uniref:lymphocyte antigen 6B-like n=1 Tax=Sinocyclocheilus grahami TaxID=75366 RepID=UPI0007AC94A4|nr:PREDICTED: lymphocyte antigen 6B-like [Sinocyclocheilus grahami]
MDLQISVFLLLLLFTAGQSLNCYKCTDLIVSCADQKEQTCPSGSYKCMTLTTVSQLGASKLTIKTKDCAPETECKPGTHQTLAGTVSVQCCDTDLCNAADGMYKGSFLLLSSPLFFYILFQ